LKKELRQQIKQDEFASWLEQALAWVTSHRDEVRIGGGVALVLVAAFGALAYFQGQRTREANQAFEDAMAAFEAPVAAQLAPGADRPAGQVFATADEKYKTAAAAFEGVVRRFGSLDVGSRARYYGALCRFELGQYADAEKALKELQSGQGKPLVSDLARLGLAQVYRRSGEVDKAVDAYRSIASDPQTTLPRDYALREMAGTLEDARRYADARQAYQELLQEFPASVYAGEARQRSEYLASAVNG
jgi:tetratricopeptide (TPR) repeat protein